MEFGVQYLPTVYQDLTFKREWDGKGREGLTRDKEEDAPRVIFACVCASEGIQ
jgi:hypothetical protein